MASTRHNHVKFLTPPARFSTACGVFCALVTALLFSLLSLSCKEKRETSPWEGKEPVQVEKTKRTKLKPELADTPTTFMAYNLRNYLTTRRQNKQRPKPEKEVNAIISNIAKVKPDILGICEIGTEADLAELQNKLNQAGCDFQHTYLVGGSDEIRRQAILSRYPITRHPSPTDTYTLNGEQLTVRRGILDATIQTPAGDIRFLGVHFKSKMTNREYDQALIRINEAYILRRRADEILQKKNAKLIAYGDFNDTKTSATMRIVKDYHNYPMTLTPVDLRASDGSRWTHHWKIHDLYSRIDFVLVSRGMYPHVQKKESYLLDLDKNDPASDHRPLIIQFK